MPFLEYKKKKKRFLNYRGSERNFLTKSTTQKSLQDKKKVAVIRVGSLYFVPTVLQPDMMMGVYNFKETIDNFSVI